MDRTELFRRIAHIGFGFGIIALMYVIGQEYVKVMLAMLFLVLLVVMDLKVKGIRVVLLDEFLSMIERPDSLPAYGAFWYTLGLLVIFSALADTGFIVTSIIMLAAGDGFAVLVGTYGRIRLPYNNAKTLEGFLGFFIAGSASYFVIGPSGIAVAFICAVVESINFPVNDNFTVPLASVIMLRVL